MNTPISSIYLFPLDTVDNLTAKGFVDPSRPTQLWFDPSAAGKTGPLTYPTINLQTLAVSSFTIDASWAAKPNVDAAKTYPPYQPDPTPAVRVVLDKSAPDVPVDPGTLATANEALAMRDKLGGATLGIAAVPSGYAINWNGETRMQWIVGSSLVGKLLQQEYANGVGAPGHWATRPVWQWIADPEPHLSDAAQSPIPMVLPAGKQIQRDMFSGDLLVVDIPGAPQPSGGATGGGLTQEQDAILRDVQRLARLIAGKFGAS